MSPTETTIADKEIRGINLRLLWFLIGGAVIGAVTFIKTIDAQNEKISEQAHKIEMLEYRVSVLEKVQDKRN